MSLFTRTLLATILTVGAATGCSSANFDVAGDLPSDDALLGVRADGGSEVEVEDGVSAEVSRDDAGAGADAVASDAAGADSGASVALDGGSSDSGSSDAGGVVDAAPEVTIVTFPSETSETVEWTTPVKTAPLGAGGGGKFYREGDRVHQTFSRTSKVTKVTLSLRMSNRVSTASCPMTLTWGVYVNGVLVGKYSWETVGLDHVVNASFVCDVAPSSGTVQIEIASLKSVCLGDGTWNWYAGGTTTFE